MKRPVVGVALGSGGARGYAHIGVLKALEEQGVPVDVVAGSSMGSLIGALYATGASTRFMEQFAAHIRRKHWLDFSVPRMGLLAGDKVREMMHLMTKGRQINEADKPLAIVTTNLLARENVILTDGSIADAVRASISIPGVFVPFEWRQGLFVDGGVLDPVPVDAAKLLGADVVVAVDVGSKTSAMRPHSMVDVILQAFEMMQDYVTSVRPKEPGVVWIEPDLQGIGISHFHLSSAAVKAGYDATMEAMSEVKAMI